MLLASDAAPVPHGIVDASVSDMGALPILLLGAALALR